MTTKEEKARRIQLRKETGSRVIDPPSQRPHGPEFLMPTACFECRLSFKRPVIDGTHNCPSCGRGAHEMGRYFRAPKKSDIEQWLKVQRLWEAGFRFYGSKDADDAPLPERLSEVEEFIQRNPDHKSRLLSFRPKR